MPRLICLCWMHSYFVGCHVTAHLNTLSSLRLNIIVINISVIPRNLPLNTIYSEATGSGSLLISQSLNLCGQRGTTRWRCNNTFPCLLLPSGSLKTPFLSIPRCYLPISSSVCLPLNLDPFTVPCRTVFAMLEDLEMWPYHPSFRFRLCWWRPNIWIFPEDFKSNNLRLRHSWRSFYLLLIVSLVQLISTLILADTK